MGGAKTVRSFLHCGLTVSLLAAALAAPICSVADETSNSIWEYGILAGGGYFNFRDSLFADVEPDPPGNLGEDWLEIYIKPWAAFEWSTDYGTVFGKASWAYARTGDAAADISGGQGDSTDFDDLYLGWRIGSVESGLFEVAGGRVPYQIANGFLLSDGYADGGSRGAVWSNPRKAWAPAARASYQWRQHRIDAFYLDRDERPESDSDTRISGIDYEWQSADSNWLIGGSYFSLDANELAPQRDGADVWSLRAYVRPIDAPLQIEAEWAYEDNGPALDATAWYVQPSWTWEDTAWQPTLYYRYAFFEGDNPATATNEAFDPLFPAFHDWGSWWQGEIAGEYFISNSNLKTHMLRLHTQPTQAISTGLILFDYSLDHPGSYQGGVDSGELGQELDWYLDWKISDMFSLSLLVARAEPGDAVEQAYDRSKAFKYAMLYLGFSY